MPLFSLDAVSTAEKLSMYDSLDDDVLRSYNEFALVSLLFYAMKEGATTEQSQRMTAMDGATKNAGKHDGLYLYDPKKTRLKKKAI